MCRQERAHVPVRAVAGLAAAAAVVLGAVWLVTATPFVAVALAVGSALAVAGIGFIVRELRHPTWGPVSQPERPAKRVRPVRRPALPVHVPLAIEAPRPVLTGIVVREAVAAGLAEAGD